MNVKDKVNGFKEWAVASVNVSDGCPDLFALIKFKDSYKKVLGIDAAPAAGIDI